MISYYYGILSKECEMEAFILLRWALSSIMGVVEHRFADLRIRGMRGTVYQCWQHYYSYSYINLQSLKTAFYFRLIFTNQLTFLLF